MTEKFEFYRCEICGNIVQVLHSGAGSLVCCGKPMTLLTAQTIENENKEKHVPVLIDDNTVQVGSVPHPMTKEHHIEFIETMSEDKKVLSLHFLEPEETPNAQISEPFDTMYEYCNLHGLWCGKK
ncbi:MAG TPA: desulfoferrodoxin [Cyanobacteria bacterium UBA11991]|nr:desulfoferrodoxin FeS4 iron-binding domain-containing protein [Cyanobacteriota bacterium]MDY6359409.1 desulfoferrodoxin FeS4 iron-binding domain-containing protein [Cyanobacteriota bacterium]MDY6364980.1 desulfoferrodoxin FeS4 iron-binding domain-containing protein [Cyanobacteriota bacterium]MDY6383263.1 desulfoferrodoxin FeS4 iron-binding domain-containing protein [Cyanobacteriota bacterium]HCB11430.1 desulfoferrodoxin [Cyanobacteria bacterium UBA11991]